jgi:hypothetical protein
VVVLLQVCVLLKVVVLQVGVMMVVELLLQMGV